MSAFRDHGFQAVHCKDAAHLQAAVRKLADGHPPEQRILALLDGSLTQVCMAARYLRTMHPAVGIVSLLPTLDERSLVEALHSGVDNFGPADASLGLVMTMLLAMLRRAMLPTAPNAPLFHGAEQWLLCDQAWVLQGPEGNVAKLTSSERAFMLSLQEAPGLRASHAELAAAVDAGNRSRSTASPKARLGVLVSRMRRKVADSQGIELPLKSLYSWGYMFAGAISRRDS